MSTFNEEFETRGFLNVPNILDEGALSRVNANLIDRSDTVAGDRRLLDHDWCRELAATVRETLEARKLITGSYVATLCTYFEKSAETNWGVASHRDLNIPVRSRFEKRGWKNWTEKQGILHVQPPRPFLLSMFAVRVNIDHSSEDNGALIVAPESHKSDDIDPPSIVVGGRPGSALMMSPLIVHASRKSLTGSNRRILHFLFGLAGQRPPIEWFYAVE